MRTSLVVACFWAGLVGGVATRTRQLADQSGAYQWGAYTTNCYFGPKPFCGDAGDALIWDKDCNGDGLHDLACVKANGERQLILGQKLSVQDGGHPFCASQPSYFSPVDEPLSYNCPLFAPLSAPTAAARRLRQQFLGSEVYPDGDCTEGTDDCGECWRGRIKGMSCWNTNEDGTVQICCQCLFIVGR